MKKKYILIFKLFFLFSNANAIVVDLFNSENEVNEGIIKSSKQKQYKVIYNGIFHPVINTKTFKYKKHYFLLILCEDDFYVLLEKGTLSLIVFIQEHFDEESITSENNLINSKIYPFIRQLIFTKHLLQKGYTPLEAFFIAQNKTNITCERYVTNIKRFFFENPKLLEIFSKAHLPITTQNFDRYKNEEEIFSLLAILFMEYMFRNMQAKIAHQPLLDLFLEKAQILKNTIEYPDWKNKALMHNCGSLSYCKLNNIGDCGFFCYSFAEAILSLGLDAKVYDLKCLQWVHSLVEVYREGEFVATVDPLLCITYLMPLEEMLIESQFPIGFESFFGDRIDIKYYPLLLTPRLSELTITHCYNDISEIEAVFRK